MAPDDPLPLPGGMAPTRLLVAMATLARRDNGTSAVTKAQGAEGIGIVNFLSAISAAVILFVVQCFFFALLRNKLARIFKPRTYLVPARERTDPPPSNIVTMIRHLMRHDDRDVINKCGLDAYFFLRYLKTLLVIFIPICGVVLPVLIPINYIGGIGQQVNNDAAKINSTTTSPSGNTTIPSGLDTLAWANVGLAHTGRYTAHLVMAILVIIWVCTVFFELRVYIKVRQDYLTSAEHRLRASATTVLVSSIPKKWLSEEALVGLFDVFPGGVRNVWLNRDLTKLLEKINLRKQVHAQLESAETDLIKAAKKAQLKRRDADEKQQRKKHSLGAVSKKEKEQRDARCDAAASQLANSGDGVNLGSHEDVAHIVDDGIRGLDGQQRPRDGGRDLETVAEQEDTATCGRMTHGLKRPLSKVGTSLRHAASRVGDEVNGTMGPRHGMMDINLAKDHTGSQDTTSLGRSLSGSEKDRRSPLPPSMLEEARTNSRAASAMSEHSTAATQKNSHSIGVATAGRRVADNDMLVRERTRFWQFWKPPSGAYTSPIPQGAAASETAEKDAKESRPFWHRVKTSLPFMGEKAEDAPEYPMAYNPDHQSDEDGGAEWKKYLKKKDRPTHRLSLFGVSWLPGLYLVSKKMDTIFWCRQELARLNVEIEDDQKHPERFPLMCSAFIQFNHQIAAHMACQSAVHHIPRHMYPRTIEISPRDVIWDNMALGWWQGWLHSAIVNIVVCAMVFLWAIPVAWTAALSQLDTLIHNADFLASLRDNETATRLLKVVSGVLPAATLAILLVLVPLILDFLAQIKGAKTGAQKTEFVQVYYFVFLFVQVFLIVSIASFFARSIDELVQHLAGLNSVSAVLDLLAKNLPASANYFFSYMILQALSTSSGTLLQIMALVKWFIFAPMFDSTARNKWTRNTELNQIQWDSFFPVYTNFACIALIYCVIAPLISIFAVITFSLLWLAQRYAMLYVNRFENDTGGVLYPRAINQTFTGIYFMELCMAGLFFIAQDTHGKHTCTVHGIIMIVVFALTLCYQVVLNKSFSPLFRYLPVTFEDEAVLRDEAFQRAQDARFGLLRETSHGESSGGDEDRSAGESPSRRKTGDRGVGLDGAGSRRDHQGHHHLKDHVKQVGHWAKDGGHQLRKLKAMSDNTKAVQYRRQQRQRDLESQRAIGDALYGGLHDDIEDLTPDERDVLTRHAFQHCGLRARRPTVWIPRDDLGISDDEIRRTNDYSEHIWISNDGTALDSKVRVVYGKNPPDFSEVDIINL